MYEENKHKEAVKKAFKATLKACRVCSNRNRIRGLLSLLSKENLILFMQPSFKHTKYMSCIYHDINEFDSGSSLKNFSTRSLQVNATLCRLENTNKFLLIGLDEILAHANFF